MRGKTISESRIRELVRFGKRVPRLLKLYKQYRKAERAAATIAARIAKLEGKVAGKRGGRRGKRNLSPAARRRISEAQKRRWAAQRRSATA